MKKLVCITVLICVVFSGWGQKNRPIAPFKMRITNGQVYTSAQLPKKKAVVLIYFSPDCDHCKALTQLLVKNYRSIADKEIVMVTYLGMNDVVAYDRLFGLSRHPNIHIGSEGYTFVVQKYYQVKAFPYVALYNRSGRFVKAFAKRENPALILKAISQL